MLFMGIVVSKNALLGILAISLLMFALLIA